MLPTALVRTGQKTVNFNATTSQYNYGNLSAGYNSNIPQTWLALIRPTGAGEGNFGYFASKVISATATGMRWMVDHNSGSPRVIFGVASGTSGPSQGAPAGSITYGRWTWVAATYAGGTNASDIHLYQGQKLLAEVASYPSPVNGSGSVNQNASDPFIIGNRNGGDRTFNGDIAMVVRWDSILDLAELQYAIRRGPLMVRRDQILLCWAGGRDISPHILRTTSVTAPALGRPTIYPLETLSYPAWMPEVVGGSTSKSVSDSASASDSLSGVSVALGVSDVGTGADVPAALILIAIADALSGVDAIAGLSVSLAIADVGAGADAGGSTVTLTVTDIGSATDAVSVITDIIIAVSDAAAASDSIGISVALGLVDVGSGADSLGVTVALSVADAGSGADSVSVLTATLIAIADSLSGVDSIGAVTVSVPLSDAFSGADALSMSALVSVLQSASGADVVVRYDSTGSVRIAKITFTLARRSVTWAFAKRAITFTLQ